MQIRNPRRIDAILDEIKYKWKQYPDMSFHTLLFDLNIEKGNEDKYNKSDQEILDTLKLKEKEYEVNKYGK